MLDRLDEVEDKIFVHLWQLKSQGIMFIFTNAY